MKGGLANILRMYGKRMENILFDVVTIQKEKLMSKIIGIF